MVPYLANVSPVLQYRSHFLAVPITFLTDWGGSLRALTHFLAVPVTFLTDGGLLKGTDALFGRTCNISD